MLLIPKLQTSLRVVFILITAGTITAAAQTPAAPNPASTGAVTIAAAPSEPKKVEAAKPSTPAESTSTARTSEVDRDANNSKPAAVTTAPTAPAKAVTSPEAAVPQGTQTDKWQFQFSPYLWLAGLHGTAGVGTRTTQVDESFSDVFHSLKFAFMGVFEARKGKLVSLTDLEYVRVGDDKATPGPLFSNVDARFNLFIFDQEVGYRVYDEPDKGAFVDVVGGARVWHVSTDLAFGAGILPATTVQGSRTWVDGVVGLRGKAALSEKIFLTGKFDLGGGGSKFSYQIFAGGGYNVNKTVALILGYRVMDVDYNKNGFIYDMNQRGPIVGVGFRF